MIEGALSLIVTLDPSVNAGASIASTKERSVLRITKYLVGKANEEIQVET